MDDVEGRVVAARGGDSTAWRQLVDGHTGLVWSVIRGFRFDEDTSKDVFQTVWLRLAEHVDRIREPSKLASWLGQTTRNECIGVVRQRSRVVVTDEVIDLGRPVESLRSAEPAPKRGFCGRRAGRPSPLRSSGFPNDAKSCFGCSSSIRRSATTRSRSCWSYPSVVSDRREPAVWSHSDRLRRFFVSQGSFDLHDGIHER